MKTKFLIFILSLQCSFIFGINRYLATSTNEVVDSVSYFGNSACWSYRASVYERILDGFRTTSALSSIIGDSLIKHHKYLKSYSETGFPILIRQENKKIYIWSDDSNNDVLLYDFDVKKGDTIRSTAQSGYFLQLPKVSVVDTIQLYNGDYRKRIKISNGDTWIEGIGSVNGFYYPLRVYVTCDCNSSFELISFAREKVLSFYNSELCATFGCCEGTIDDLKNTQIIKEMFAIYPNPTKEIITIKFVCNIEKSNIELFDLQGKTVINKQINETNNSVRLNQLPKGIYFYRISTDGKLLQTGKLSKE